MRRLLITGAVLAAIAPAGVVAASTPPDSTPPDSSMTMTSEPMTSEVMTSMPVSSEVMTGDTMSEGSMAPSAEPATIYDDDGNAVATVTVSGTEMQWTDYAEGDEPDEGNEYVRVTVTVASQKTEDTFGINTDDFILVDLHGKVDGADNVKTAAQSDADEDVTTEADLANGESVELALTFQVDTAVGPQSVFYRPDDDNLVHVIDLA
jgi:Domain of unknown function (DUF4352)